MLTFVVSLVLMNFDLVLLFTFLGISRVSCGKSLLSVSDDLKLKSIAESGDRLLALQQADNTTTTTSTSTSIPSTTTSPPLTIDHQSCCGSTCRNFKNPLNMVLLDCCGMTIFDTGSEICCNGEVHNRVESSTGIQYDRCCGKQPFTFRDTCCNGTVFTGVSAQSCCGSQPYDTYDKTKRCCGSKIFTVGKEVTPACCGTNLYDAWSGSQFCCGNQVFNLTTHDSCCLNFRTSDSQPQISEGFDLQTQQCCDKVYNRSFYDTCCYVFDQSNPATKPKPSPYNSSIQCCTFQGVRQLNATGQCP